MKNSISEFLSSAFQLKNFFNEIQDSVIVLIQSAKKVYDLLNNKYYSDQKDKITFGHIRDCLLKAENNFSNLTVVSQFISTMSGLLVEVSTTIYVISNEILAPKKF